MEIKQKEISSFHSEWLHCITQNCEVATQNLCRMGMYHRFLHASIELLIRIIASLNDGWNSDINRETEDLCSLPDRYSRWVNASQLVSGEHHQPEACCLASCPYDGTSHSAHDHCQAAATDNSNVTYERCDCLVCSKQQNTTFFTTSLSFKCNSLESSSGVDLRSLEKLFPSKITKTKTKLTHVGEHSWFTIHAPLIVPALLYNPNSSLEILNISSVLRLPQLIPIFVAWWLFSMSSCSPRGVRRTPTDRNLLLSLLSMG